MSALKLRSIVASHYKLTTINGEQSSKPILLQLHEKLLKNSMLTTLWSFGIWSKLKKWKNSVCGCFMNWQQIKKIAVVLKCFLLFYTKTMNHFLIRLWHAMKSVFYMTTDQPSGWTEMTSSMVGLRRSSKALPKAKLASEKDHGHCLVVGWPFDLRQFLNLSEIITSEKYAQQISVMHPKLKCLQPALVNRKGPILLHDNT